MFFFEIHERFKGHLLKELRVSFEYTNVEDDEDLKKQFFNTYKFCKRNINKFNLLL